FRFFVELFREPDPQLGFILGPFTMGQTLSALMILGGIILYLALKRK
ncbi:MAG: prolipoprotein diacylglyceryl transferase, partial [Deltaproteobacteria bacterium]|nr:prolipoprotein diacylglyceryl transferase [Deltaproteobacteria bacterium]